VPDPEYPTKPAGTVTRIMIMPETIHANFITLRKTPLSLNHMVIRAMIPLFLRDTQLLNKAELLIYPARLARYFL